VTDLQITQVGIEAWVTSDLNPDARWTQVGIEAWVATRAVRLTLPFYPTPPGLTFSVFWRPMFANLPTQVAASLAEVDLALSAIPVHEFELTYDFLRNESSHQEFKNFFGFFLRMAGNVGRFLFLNPDDYAVTAELVGTTDGAASDYGPLQRTFGDGENVGVEPVGYVSSTAGTFKVYFDGSLQDSGLYTVDRTLPCQQMLHFLSPPSADQVITVDMQYYYYCKFAEDNLSFEKFMSLLWAIKRVTLRSCKAGT
jgi:hypothetical protein